MSPERATGYGDLHSHLVPGVDDGARSVEDALEGIARMAAAGFRRIVTTPHLDGSLTREPDAFASRMDRVDEAWERVRRAVADEHPELDFRRGHEVMLDLPDVDFTDERVRLGGTSFVLVEWPRLQVPPETGRVVSRICFGGLKPVIAHPERYRGLDRDLAVVGEWRRMGAFLQISYGSLVGRYGERARRLAFRILERGWADYLSTDFHGRPHLDLHVEMARRVLADEGGEEQLGLLARVNPMRLMEDEEPLPVPPLKLGRSFWDRVKEFFAAEPG